MTAHLTPKRQPQRAMGLRRFLEQNTISRKITQVHRVQTGRQAPTQPEQKREVERGERRGEERGRAWGDKTGREGWIEERQEKNRR